MIAKGSTAAHPGIEGHRCLQTEGENHIYIKNIGMFRSKGMKGNSKEPLHGDVHWRVNGLGKKWQA